VKRYLTRTRPHPSIRLRTSLTIAVVFVLTCAALLAINYGLLRHGLTTDLDQSPLQAKGAVEHPGTQRDTQPGALDETTSAELAARARLRDQTLTHAARTSATALAVAGVLLLAASWVVAGRMLRPLQALTGTARRISQDRLHERIAHSGPRDELKELADTFDDMVARLEASFTNQRRFVADAAHELRTPLAIVRTSAEVLLAKRQSTIDQWRAMAQDVLTATGRVEHLLDSLLALTRSDHGMITQQPYDLAVAAAAALSEAYGEADSAHLTVTTDLRPAPVSGDPVLLDRMVRNLVDNAVRHNHRDGWIDVITRHADGGAVVSVRNSGETIPAQDLDRLFEPFQRLDTDRTTAAKSTGLGLALVTSIVRAHHGTLEAAPLAEGGLAVTVTLPTHDVSPTEPTPVRDG
jgi:signal transduction histidine kinase